MNPPPATAANPERTRPRRPAWADRTHTPDEGILPETEGSQGPNHPGNGTKPSSSAARVLVIVCKLLV